MEGDRGQDGGGAPSSGPLLNLPQPISPALPPPRYPINFLFG